MDARIAAEGGRAQSGGEDVAAHTKSLLFCYLLKQVIRGLQGKMVQKTAVAGLHGWCGV
jgi:hypothetical protein